MTARDADPPPAPRRRAPGARPAASAPKAPPDRAAHAAAGEGAAPASPGGRAPGRLSRSGRAVAPPRPRPKWLIPAGIGVALLIVAAVVLIPMMEARNRRAAAGRELADLRKRAEAAAESLDGVADVRAAFDAYVRRYPEPEWADKAKERRVEFDADVRRKERAPLENEAGGWVYKALEEVRKHEAAGDLVAAVAVEKTAPAHYADTEAFRPFQTEMERLRPLLAAQRRARWEGDAAEADRLAAAREWSGAISVLDRVLAYGDEEQAGAARRRMKEIRAERAAVPGVGPVIAALTWLARHQSEDGGWEPALFHLECQGGRCTGTGNAKYGIGVTALGALAFLGAGYGGSADEAYVDPLGRKPRSFTRAAARALERLRQSQGPDGAFAAPGALRPMFSHALATLAQAEAARWLADPAAAESARKGVEYLIAGRVPGKGWRYEPKTDKADSAVTGWALIALWSARQAGIPVEEAAVAEARGFLDSLTDANYGRCGYLHVKDIGGKVVDGDLGVSRVAREFGRGVEVGNLNEAYADHEALSAEAMAARFLSGGDTKDVRFELTAKALVQDLPYWDTGKKSIDYYYWFFGTLALSLLEGADGLATGKYGKHWSKAASETISRNQDGEDAGCSHGSWAELERWSHAGGRPYGAALNAITLQVLFGFERALGRTAGK